MDGEYRQRLQADADGGNKIAERLLLNAWLAEENHDEIRALLDRYVAKNDGTGKQYLEAELSCFHGWPSDQSWQEMLRECCDAGHREALFVNSVYREWASFSVFQGTTLVAADGIHSEATVEHTVPVGPLRVVLQARSMKHVEERVIDAAAGERGNVKFVLQ